MTKRGDMRAQRARDRAMRLEYRRMHERDRAAIARARPNSYGRQGGTVERWIPVPETDYEVNQYGNVRKREGNPR